ncbi:MAG: hypothetical protein CGW95_15685 [Phenylobacterium zucineum]|nr:MAG: hypothetical protein CGW95_15685 [Phenylobacterium zucineum]
MSAKSKASPNVNNDSFDAKGPIDPSKALVPETLKVNERRVRRGFLPKVARFAAAIPFASDIVSVWYCAQDPETPLAAKGMMMAALAYFVLPMDAVPDFLGVIGFTDDAAVLAAVIAVVGRHLKPEHRKAADALLIRLQQP